MSRPKCYHTMDAFVKLVVVLVRYSGEPSNTLAKVNLLSKVSILMIIWFFIILFLKGPYYCDTSFATGSR